jgi:hypothetical protein
MVMLLLVVVLAVVADLPMLVYLLIGFQRWIQIGHDDAFCGLPRLGFRAI